MSTDNGLQPAEKAEQHTAIFQGAVLEKPSQPEPVSLQASRGSSLTSTLHTDLSPQDQQEARQDADNLEELAAVPTGPVYSAFSKRKKNAIICMVTSKCCAHL